MFEAFCSRARIPHFWPVGVSRARVPDSERKPSGTPYQRASLDDTRETILRKDSHLCIILLSRSISHCQLHRARRSHVVFSFGSICVYTYAAAVAPGQHFRGGVNLRR